MVENYTAKSKNKAARELVNSLAKLLEEGGKKLADNALAYTKNHQTS